MVPAGEDTMSGTAFITGASSGIGRGIALRLAREGWHILAQGRREDALDETLELIEKAGGSGARFCAEMGSMDDLAALADWVASKGPLKAFVHCAAKFTYGPVSTDRFEDWDKSIDAVLRSTIRLTAYSLPALTEGSGSVVYICGPTSWLGWKNHAIHCALRHAQVGFAKALFEDVREVGVGVTVVHPGFVNTPSVNSGGKNSDLMIQTEDIAEMVWTSITLPKTACVTEFQIRPQRSPYT